MKKVFEPGEMELADPRGDPNRVIAIQTKVKELIEANEQRRIGIASELFEEGAWALPGLLNSTYVWMNLFEENKDARDVMAKILAELARENESAVALLFDSGVLENPFKIPREIVLKALEDLNWKPTPEHISKINSRIIIQRNAADIDGLMLSYKLLANSGDKAGFNLMLKQCETWIEDNLASGVELFGLLVKYYPESTEKILTDVILAAPYNEKVLAGKMIAAIRPIPANWWLDSKILKISISVLEESNPPRNTAIEFLWKFAAQDAKRGSPQFWTENCIKVNKLVFDAVSPLDDDLADILFRYWSMAIGEVADDPEILKFLVNSIFSETELWAVNAATQLFFMRGSESGKNRKPGDGVENALNKLSSENYYRYQRAEAKFNLLSSKNKPKTETRSHSSSSNLTD